MGLYWRHYNAVIHVVHQAAFEEDRENGRTQYYSGFLHICMLAIAYQRFADKSRPDMRKIGLPARESTFHKEAKYMLDCEQEQPGGIPFLNAALDETISVGYMLVWQIGCASILDCTSIISILDFSNVRSILDR